MVGPRGLRFSPGLVRELHSDPSLFISGVSQPGRRGARNIRKNALRPLAWRRREGWKARGFDMSPKHGNPMLIVALLTALLLPAVLHPGAQLFAQNTPTDPPTDPPTDTNEVETNGNSKILEGKVQLMEFLRFIQKSTGKLVNYPSADKNNQDFSNDVTIDVLSDVEPLTYPIVKALLEANGYELYEETLEDGTDVINIRATTARKPTQEAPKPTEIIDSSEIIPEAQPDHLATLVLQLRYADTSVVLQALRDLLGVGGPQGRTGGGVTIVNITTTQTLIIKGKKQILRHIQELVKFIDVETPGPETFLKVIAVFNADAQELVTILQDILDLQSTGVQRSGSRSTPRPQGGNAPRPTPGGGSNLNEKYTRLIADVRTQKIIVDTSSEEDLELIMNLVDELDTEVRNLRPSNHIYRVRFLKAEDLQQDLQALLDGTRTTGGLTGRNRGTTGRGNTRGANPQQQGQQQQLASRVIAHDETNSLIIQAEYEEYLEIKEILEGIDIKRRQVFLEVALVQVNQSSTLNYVLEYLAGNLDDRSTRLAALTAFGLSTLDVTQLPANFDRVINPTAPQTGLLAAVSRDGQLPVLVRAIKSDSNAAVIATPFILADDNEPNSISIQTELFFQTSTLNDNFSQGGQDSEEAGVTLNLQPTISESVVRIELNLEVSSFAGAGTTTGTLPDRNINTIESRVTIPDGRLFIIGGLARETKALSVDKVPILGDLPLLGRLFQSRSSDKRRDNLYVFLTAHILSGENFDELGGLTDEAVEKTKAFGEDIEIQHFQDPTVKSNENNDNETGSNDDGTEESDQP